ncbi:MAG: LytTR family DNA-binding domain-containing protein [Bacteroidales bacterium]|nr:LytTR family DNA-binding domain-containing protein [Bacteroidales bacterium]
MTESETSIKALIIEDEEPARKLVRHFLESHPIIEIAGECADGFCGAKLIRELSPDLLFLDIQMPRLTGFELLEVIDDRPEIIFTTAYDEFAIQAFEINAVDYLLKPFSRERFDAAVVKAVKKIAARGHSGEGKRINPDSRMEGSMPLNRIVIRKGTAISFIAVRDIEYIEAEDDYVMIWYPGGKALKQQTMKYYEENLPAEDFVRIHRSCIVAIDLIERIEPYGKETYRVLLRGGKRLPVSRSGYKALKDKISF